MLHKRRIMTTLLGLGIAHGLYAAAGDGGKSIRDLEGFPNFEAPIVYGHNLYFEQKGLTNLDGLDEIKTIDLKKVHAIHLVKNKIQSISDDAFSTFERLEVLFLSGNQLTAIPAAVASLSNLGLLCISGNKISTVDAYPLEKLKQLQSLILANNDIEYFDPSLASNLSKQGAAVFLSGNRLNKKHAQKLKKAYKKTGPCITLYGQKEPLSVQERGKNIKRAKR